MNGISTIDLEGIVLDVMPGSLFRVKLDNGFQVVAPLAKAQRPYLRLTIGDRVTVKCSFGDLTNGQISHRIAPAGATR